MILAPEDVHVVDWLRSHAAGLRDLQSDSRRIAPGDVFIAMPGAVASRSADGRSFVDAAVARGASAAIVEADGWQARDHDVPMLEVAGLRRRSGTIAAAYYGQPSADLRCIGITGTNGKTSCSHWIAQLLSMTGTRCAVIGTLGTGFPGEEMTDTELTTPDAVALQRGIRRLADRGARALAMEVSSIGLEQGRANGTQFAIAVFTNLTRDHLDYHGTMVRYEDAKASLFDWPTLTHAVVNLDDEAGARIVRRIAGRAGLHVTGYSTRGGTDAGTDRVLRAMNLRATAAGLAFDLQVDGRTYAIDVPLVGDFNVANLLAVTGAAMACGVELATIVPMLSRLAPPPGRMQRLGGDGALLVVIDYAHTPDALEKALLALRPLAQVRGGKLWAVFGAGGDRDRGKRVSMGQVAAQHADRVIVTSDNPRTEDPARIAADIATGIAAATSFEQILDRATAIDHAVRCARPQDIVLVAGKGHEPYQDIGGVKRPFLDADAVGAALARRGAALHGEAAC